MFQRLSSVAIWGAPVRFRLLAAVVAVVGVVAVGVTVRTDDAKAVEGCADVLFIGVHGVGEDPRSSNNNMGPTIFKMFNDYFRPWVQSQSPGANVGGFGVNYPKIDLVQLVGQKGVANLAGDNVAEGVRALHQAVTTQIRVCPGKAIVLAGYSEGAWVIDQFLHDNSSLVGAITAVALFGDPQFDHNAPRNIIKSAVNGDGVARDFSLVLSAGRNSVVVHPFAINPYLPSRLNDRAASWCLAEQQGKNLVHDPVCNWRLYSPQKKETVGWKDCAQGRSSCVHFRYDQAGLLAAGASFLISKLPPLGLTPSTSTVPPPTSTVPPPQLALPGINTSNTNTAKA